MYFFLCWPHLKTNFGNENGYSREKWQHFQKRIKTERFKLKLPLSEQLKKKIKIKNKNKNNNRDQGLSVHFPRPNFYIPDNLSKNSYLYFEMRVANFKEIIYQV